METAMGMLQDVSQLGGLLCSPGLLLLVPRDIPPESRRSLRGVTASWQTTDGRWQLTVGSGPNLIAGPSYLSHSISSHRLGKMP
mgnify:FL=1